VCPHDATQAAQAVDRLDDRFDQNRVGSITVWQLTGGRFDLTEQFVGGRLFLWRHYARTHAKWVPEGRSRICGSNMREARHSGHLPGFDNL
jgi:hypothetical protein